MVFEKTKGYMQKNKSPQKCTLCSYVKNRKKVHNSLRSCFNSRWNFFFITWEKNIIYLVFLIRPEKCNSTPINLSSKTWFVRMTQAPKLKQLMIQVPKPKLLISPTQILLSNLASLVDSSVGANGIFWKHECTDKLASLL